MKHLIVFSIFLFLLSCKDDEKVEQKNWDHVNTRINNPRYESDFSFDATNYDGVIYIKAENSDVKSGLEDKSVEIESYFKNGDGFKSVSNFMFQDEAISSSDGGGFTYYWKFKSSINLNDLNQFKITFQDGGEDYSLEIPFQNQYENISLSDSIVKNGVEITLNYFTDNIYFLNLDGAFDEFGSLYRNDVYYDIISSKKIYIGNSLYQKFSEKGVTHKENSKYMFNLFSYKRQEITQNEKKFLVIIRTSIYFELKD